MDKQEYLALFDKFLNDQATPPEVLDLISWFKARGGFEAWADDQWLEAPAYIDPELRQKLFNRIREKIHPEPPGCFGCDGDRRERTHHRHSAGRRHESMDRRKFMSNKEIALVLDLSENTVESQISKAVSFLRKRLAKHNAG